MGSDGGGFRGPWLRRGAVRERDMIMSRYCRGQLRLTPLGELLDTK